MLSCRCVHVQLRYASYCNYFCVFPDILSCGFYIIFIMLLLCRPFFQLLPESRTSFMPELDPASCMVHRKYSTRPDRITTREASQWSAFAVQKRVDRKLTTSVGEMFPGVDTTRISRLRAHELIETYTEVSIACAITQLRVTSAVIAYNDGVYDCVSPLNRYWRSSVQRMESLKWRRCFLVERQCLQC